MGTGDGANPFAPLVQAADGNFYGTTTIGGGNPCNCGTVFKMTPKGVVTTLYAFGPGGDFTNGADPIGGLVEGPDGNLYGTTTGGGTHSGGSGTVFKITTTGTLTPLHAFSGYPGDGSIPYAGLTLGSDGVFYGTTFQGGSQGAACNCGTIYSITSTGTLTLLHSFTNGSDGRNPYGGLVQYTDGTFYGTTLAGGPNQSVNCTYDSTQTCGTVFSFSAGAAPFVRAIPTAGRTAKGKRKATLVSLLGNSLSGATAVSFNGVAATFTVNSSTQIDTKVPAGATTGFITVTIPGGTLTSNTPFVVF